MMNNQYLDDKEDDAVGELTTKYDAYSGVMTEHWRRVSSVDGSETATDDSSVSGASAQGGVSDHERLQVETFFRGLKTQVFVCGSLANLYYGSNTISIDKWELHHTGIPVLILDCGETRSRNKRRIQIILAERGTCFALWSDTIDNLSSYRVAGQAFHTMHFSSDHTALVGFSFDSLDAADELFNHVEKLTANPENISLSMAGKRNRKARKVPKVKPPSLPSKKFISQPCCFQHITSVDEGDRSRYISLQTLLPEDSKPMGVQIIRT